MAADLPLFTYIFLDTSGWNLYQSVHYLPKSDNSIRVVWNNDLDNDEIPCLVHPGTDDAHTAPAAALMDSANYRRFSSRDTSAPRR